MRPNASRSPSIARSPIASSRSCRCSTGWTTGSASTNSVTRCRPRRGQNAPAPTPSSSSPRSCTTSASSAATSTTTRCRPRCCTASSATTSTRVVLHHQDFTARYIAPIFGGDAERRDRWRDEPWFGTAERFADEWDQLQLRSGLRHRVTHALRSVDPRDLRAARLIRFRARCRPGTADRATTGTPAAPRARSPRTRPAARSATRDRHRGRSPPSSRSARSARRTSTAAGCRRARR